jgi:hypothetical protein
MSMLKTFVSILQDTVELSSISSQTKLKLLKTKTLMMMRQMMRQMILLEIIQIKVMFGKFLI